MLAPAGSDARWQAKPGERLRVLSNAPLRSRAKMPANGWHAGQQVGTLTAGEGIIVIECRDVDGVDCVRVQQTSSSALHPGVSSGWTSSLSETGARMFAPADDKHTPQTFTNPAAASPAAASPSPVAAQNAAPVEVMIPAAAALRGPSSAVQNPLPVSRAPVHAFSDVHAPAGRTFHEYAPCLCPLCNIGPCKNCRLSPIKTLMLEERSGRIILKTKQTGCCKYIMGADELTTCVHARNALSVTNAREGTDWKEKLSALSAAAAISAVIVSVLSSGEEDLDFEGAVDAIFLGVVVTVFVFVGLLALIGWFKPDGLVVYVHEGPLGSVFIPLKKSECIEARDAVLEIVEADHQ